MTTQRELVYILIPVHNRKAITLKCLETLKQNGDLGRYYVVVIDDGSTDGTKEAIHHLYPEVTVLQGDGNLWWTGAIKMGMEYAYQQGAEYLIWLNDDCLVELNTFADLIKFCQENPDSIIGCQGVETDNHNNICFGGKVKNLMSYSLINCPKGKTLQCDLLSGNLVCISRKVIDKSGYPSPELVPHYGGDSVYLIKARKAGFKIFVDNRHQIFNLCGDSDISPQRWLLKEGKAEDIIKLFFNPYSLYSWRVWLALNKAEYGKFMGLFSFLAYYTIRFFIPIALITILRFLPLSFRKQLSNIKRQLTLYS